MPSSPRSGSSKTRPPASASSSRRRPGPGSSQKPTKTATVAKGDAPRPADDGSSNRPPPYDKYKPAFRLVFLHFAVFLGLFLLAVVPPDGHKGLSAVIKSGTSDYLGLLEYCSGSSCGTYLSSGTSSSSSSSTSPSSSSSSTGSRRDLLLTRASSGSFTSIIDLPSFFLSTSIAFLTALWIQGLIFLFTLYNWLASRPPTRNGGTGDTDSEDAEGESKRGKIEWYSPSNPDLKRYTYRARRLFGLVNLFVVLGVAGRCTDLGEQVRSALGLGWTDGVGIGSGILHASWIILLFLLLIELLPTDNEFRRGLLWAPEGCSNCAGECCDWERSFQQGPGTEAGRGRPR